GSCINDTTRKASVEDTTAGHLRAHRRTCECRKLFNSTTILAENKSPYAREMLATMAIEENEATSVSLPSIKLNTQKKSICGVSRSAKLRF
ncbi:MAG: hypothetical protein PV344_02940, partial [Anaplasma sp.]|nr:hypothetical protein [Anaplasma sp.]